MATLKPAAATKNDDQMKKLHIFLHHGLMFRCDPPPTLFALKRCLPHSLFARSKASRPLACGVIALLACVMQNGCETYQSKPVSEQTLTDFAAPRQADELSRAAASLKHPLLPAITIADDGTLTPDAAAVISVLQSPSLKAARLRQGLADAQLLQAGILPNPQLSGNVEVPVSGDTQGTTNGYGIGASWDVSSLIARRHVQDAARNEARSIQLDIAWQEWQYAMSAKLHAIRVYWLGVQEASLVTEVQTARAAAQEAVQNSKDGFATSIDAEAALGLASKRQEALFAVRATLASENAQLIQTLGLPPDSRIKVVADSADAQDRPLPGPETIEQSIRECRLDLAALRAGYESQESKLHQAVLSQFPNIGISLSHARDTGNVGTLGFGVTLDLPIFDRGQARIALERATREQLFAELAARTFDARAEAARACTELASIDPRIEAAAQTEHRLTALESSLADARRSGDADVVALNQVRNDLAEARLESLQLRQERAELQLALEVATGRWNGATNP
jgi:outer membrane protein TolC